MRQPLGRCDSSRYGGIIGGNITGWVSEKVPDVRSLFLARKVELVKRKENL